jgi:regulator of sirC expression with transglutaminase-like and TPR domain/5-hydroxyisourate hydrolase-like protein (transthyretin family)
MRRLINITTILILSLAMVTATTAQVRGRGRLQGVVLDKATGKPVEGATVTLVPSAEQTQPLTTKSDSKGHWSALGLTSGGWNIDIAANGYDTSRGTASVSEMQMSPMIKTELTPAARQEQTPVAAAPTALIPNEAVNAIREGQDLLKIKAGDVVTSSQASGGGASAAVSHTVTADEAKKNAERAVVDFETALPLLPDDKPETKEIRSQLMQVMAQAYYRAGDVAKAISMLEQLNTVDPWTTPDPGITQRNILLVNLYLEHGDLGKGRTLLEKLPAGAVTDPTIYMNIGILFLNKNNPRDAEVYFTKAVDMDPKRAESYYYRGLSELQLKKNKEAKADFNQVLALSPDSPEAKDAKQYLTALK